MSTIRLEPPLAPRNGRTLRAIGITRISTLNQDPKSLEDQKALLIRWVADRFDGSVEWTFIEGQGSGECLERDQVFEADRLVETQQYDLVLMEDIARHMRRMQAFFFCEKCEDAGTRLVAINDNIDTARDWRLHACFAAMKHEQSNKDTSERIRERVLALRADGKTERQIAKELGITVTTAQRAARLDRLMKQQDLSDSYVPIHEPPADHSKLRRHLHPRYRFEPLPVPRTAG